MIDVVFHEITPAASADVTHAAPLVTEQPPFTLASTAAATAIAAPFLLEPQQPFTLSSPFTLTVPDHPLVRPTTPVLPAVSPSNPFASVVAPPLPPPPPRVEVLRAFWGAWNLGAGEDVTDTVRQMVATSYASTG